MLCAAAHRDARSDVSPGRPATDDASDELTRPHHECRRALTSFLRRNNITRLRTDHRKQTGCLRDRVESRAFSLGRCKRAYEISESNSVGVILMLSRDGICQSAISIVTAGRHWSAPRGQVPPSCPWRSNTVGMLGTSSYLPTRLSSPTTASHSHEPG